VEVSTPLSTHIAVRHARPVRDRMKLFVGFTMPPLCYAILINIPIKEAVELVSDKLVILIDAAVLPFKVKYL
jgi:hypothetical protein